MTIYIATLLVKFHAYTKTKIPKILTEVAGCDEHQAASIFMKENVMDF